MGELLMINAGIGTGIAAQGGFGGLKPTQDRAQSVINHYLYAKTPQATSMFADELRRLDTKVVGAIIKALDCRIAHSKENVWLPRLKEFRLAAQHEWDNRLCRV